jgi:hypothetical protein
MDRVVESAGAYDVFTDVESRTHLERPESHAFGTPEVLLRYPALVTFSSDA